MVECWCNIWGVTPYNFLFQNNKNEPLLPHSRAEIFGKTFPQPSIATSFSAPTTISLYLFNHYGLHYPSTTQATITVKQQICPYNHNFDDVSIDFLLSPLYFTFITDTVLVPMPLPRYPLY